MNTAKEVLILKGEFRIRESGGMEPKIVLLSTIGIESLFR